MGVGVFQLDHGREGCLIVTEAQENRTILGNQLLGAALAQRDTLERIERMLGAFGGLCLLVLAGVWIGRHVSSE